MVTEKEALSEQEVLSWFAEAGSRTLAVTLSYVSGVVFPLPRRDMNGR